MSVLKFISETRLVCAYQHVQDSNCAIYRVLEVKRMWTFFHNLLSHLLSLFCCTYIQTHILDLLILLSFVTVTQELTEPYLSKIYSFCARSDQSTSSPKLQEIQAKVRLAQWLYVLSWLGLSSFMLVQELVIFCKEHYIPTVLFNHIAD